MVLSSADFFFKISFFCCCCLFYFFFFWGGGNLSRVSVGSDLGLNCLQRLSADDTSK